MTSEMTSVAVLGIGLMGTHMAARLMAAGFPLTVWNRSAGKTDALAAKGARVAATAAEAVLGADVVITMLFDGAAVTKVLIDSGAIANIKSGALVIDMSSITPAVARDHAAKLAAKNVAYLDAPVSGGTKGAEAGTLAIMAGGNLATFERARPIFEAMGRPTLVGPTGTGQIAKLANQSIVAVTIGAVAEALLLAANAGADPAKVREALSGGFADSPIMKQHGQRMLDRTWLPGAQVKMHVKDLRAILSAADSAGLELPIAETVAALFEDLAAAGYEKCDHSALLLELERLNPGKRMGDKPDTLPPK